MLSHKKVVNEASYSIDLQDNGQISAVHFSSYELTQNLLLLAFPNKLILTEIVFKDDLEMQRLAEFSNAVSCTALALSPETCITALPINVLFCAAGSDFNLRVFESNLSGINNCRVLSGHTDFINEVSYDPESNFVASVSDDNTARIWSTLDYSCIAVLHLMSPGMSTCWHKDDPAKLMVAEKVGVIRFYNVNTQKPILSLDFGKPLSAAHWSPKDTQSICSLHLGEVVQWDLTRPSRPIHVKLLHSMAGGFIKYNTTGELIATVNKLEGSIKVLHAKSQQEQLTSMALLPSNISWHYRLPIFCLADDGKVSLWKVSQK